MRNVCYIAVIFLMSFSCGGYEEQPFDVLSGTYEGTFQRTVGNEPGEISAVTINFGKTAWAGESQIPKYPALCHGTYQIKDSMITFSNNCFFTAEFDWSLILDGEFEMKISADNVQLSKIIGKDTSTRIVDTYVLKRTGTTAL